MSEIAKRPPGRSARAISANTRSFSGDRLITQLEMTQSTDASSTGSDSISPLRTSTLSWPAAAMFSRAFWIISSVMSTPITRPSGPTVRAAIKRSKPAPEPRSRTVWPASTSLNANGLPQPKELVAASAGTAPSSAS
jgi:hypothetical protein